MIATGTHDPYLVALSILVAAFASYTALDLGARVGVARGLARRVWLVAAAVTMGGGIWSMHFVAMLAFKMPFAMSYDVGLTILSLAATWLTFGTTRLWQRLGAAAVMGVAISGMHYTAMRAAHFTAHGQVHEAQRHAGLDQTHLALVVAGTTFVILAVALIASL